jgi:hypothetical protein
MPKELEKLLNVPFKKTRRDKGTFCPVCKVTSYPHTHCNKCGCVVTTVCDNCELEGGDGDR